MKIHMRTFWCHAVALDNAVYWLWFFGGGSACHCNNFGSLHVACGRVILTKQSPCENLHVIWVAISPQMQDSFCERKNDVHYIYFPPTCAQYYSPFWDRNWCKYCSFIVINGPATASNCKSITSLPNAKVPHVEHKFCRLSFYSRSPQNTSNLHDWKLLHSYSKWRFHAYFQLRERMFRLLPYTIVSCFLDTLTSWCRCTTCFCILTCIAFIAQQSAPNTMSEAVNLCQKSRQRATGFINQSVL